MRLFKAALERLRDHCEASYECGDRQHATDLRQLLNFYNITTKQQDRANEQSQNVAADVHKASLPLGRDGRE